MKTFPALLFLGATVLPAWACDSLDPARAPEVCSVASAAATAPKVETKLTPSAPHAPVAPAPKSTGKTREARRTPPPAHLFM